MQSEQNLKSRLIVNEDVFTASLIDQNLFDGDKINPDMYQKPLDLYMVCTGQEDVDGYLQPLNVFTQKIQPKTYYLSDGKPYIPSFDENSYKNPRQFTKNVFLKKDKY